MYDRLAHHVHWLSDVNLGGFAPALASLIFNSLCPSADGQRMLPPSADGQMPITSVVSSKPKKIKSGITFINPSKGKRV